jgi:DNA-binding FadR family transcriptional regulator
MKTKLNRIEKRPRIVESVTQAILQLIPAEGLQPGDELPAQSVLERELGVSRNSVREACQRLVALGAVEMQPGRRMTVGEAVGRVTASSDIHSLESTLQDRALADILELRCLLEPEVAALATQRATDGQIQDLEAILGKMRAARSPRRAWRLSFSFHRALAACSGNDAAAEFITWIEHTTTEVYPDIYQHWRETNPGDSDVGEHYEIYLAVKQRDSEKVRQLMRQHICRVSEIFLGDRVKTVDSIGLAKYAEVNAH